MKKSTKGAIAAVGAAALLLGGAGTLAYWNAEAPVAGGTINAGELKLTDTSDCENLPWTLDGGEDAAGVSFDPDTDLVVPGDVLTKTCDFGILAQGEHLRATTGFTDPTATGSLGVTPAASFTIGGDAVTEITEANNGDTLSAVVTLTVNAANDNTTQLTSSVLSDYVVTLTQVHN
ncbi:MAG: alternate-type signal peptide domain-containing protein [Leucobacter sp.]